MYRLFLTLAATLGFYSVQSQTEVYEYMKVTVQNKSENHLISDSLRFVWSPSEKIGSKVREVKITEKKTNETFRWVVTDGRPDHLFYEDLLLATVSYAGITQITIGDHIYDVERGKKDWIFTRYRKMIIAGEYEKNGSEKKITLKIGDPDDPNLEILRILSLQYGYSKIDGQSNSGLIIGTVVGLTVIRIFINIMVASAN